MKNHKKNNELNLNPLARKNKYIYVYIDKSDSMYIKQNIDHVILNSIKLIFRPCTYWDS